ncbi:hypothetical protein ABEB36_010468 [Hypothenemus hampei]|uniref:G-protein coupled receptors family 1 profile domain-containing protein n=1 Tax=Hypothenemus hampei TaxID=57062 RepID=A0ABD1EJU2_HYPHA
MSAEDQLLDPENNTNNTQMENCGGDSTTTEQSYIFLPILLGSCLIAMIVNVIVIASARWIRCSMTPNLKISLSLAAADATSSTMYGLIVLISGYGYNLGVFLYIVELLRLSGIVVTVVHLLALSLNHYIGILKPLHYNSIVTSKKVSTVIWMLWLVPFFTVVGICTAFDVEGTFWNNLRRNTNEDAEFMSTFSFRITYSSLFFIPILIMVVCYTHILIVVKKQQIRWNNLSRVGSTRVQGKPNQKMSREHKQLEGNVRAIYTTLLILGSCFIGWAPALLSYTMMCMTGCYISGADLDDFNCRHAYLIMGLRMTDNILIILKMLANPIIYSIRMREIKDGTYRMLLAIIGLFSKSRREAMESSGFYYRSRLQNSIGGGTIQVRVISMKNGNGNQLMSAEENTLL